MDDDPALTIPLCDRFMQIDPRISQLIGRDPTEHVGRHSAKGRPSDGQFGKRTGIVAQNDGFVADFDDEKIAADATLQIDE